ncbi:type 2 lactosamine alpha-2,3-sialyltransferase isoform X5 [Rissa tridactyla]|uniref:type 2 lactosamine alpha-2,3-sialyltransferase isoform X5 n=1 Tax=Rissa tridactyla TaxID=75485 RepID=UPI0023BABA23|nr:type 2 lactosamine alpha-2,3-sialyltransferase isoform X5 [Rissa tridactyla]
MLQAGGRPVPGTARGRGEAGLRRCPGPRVGPALAPDRRRAPRGAASRRGQERGLSRREEAPPSGPGLPVMRRILLFFILAAAVMYGILHGNLWRNNLYWISFYGQTSSVRASPSYEASGVTQLPPTAVERRNALDTCLLKPAFESLLSIACRRCVVVGNGGVLRNKTLGEKIDSYDVIIRMNNGPVIGYEEDVGRRTTFRLSYPESIFSDPIHYDPNTTVVLIVFKPRDLKWLWEILGGQKISAKGFWKKPALNMIYKSSQIRILDPSITRKTAYEWLNFPTRFPKKESPLSQGKSKTSAVSDPNRCARCPGAGMEAQTLQSLWKPKHPTTGLIAITLAFHICHEVHLAGFKYDFSDRNSSLHYYGNDTMSQMIQNEYHNINAEQKFLKQLIDKNFVVNLT